jgi:hypothetical protein
MPTSNNHINNSNNDIIKKQEKIIKEIKKELIESLSNKTPQIIDEIIEDKKISKK